MSSKPILLVEDNEKLRRLFSDMLESVGYNVMKAANGEKAIELFHKIGNPQLIVLDIMMPQVNGIETCSRIRKMQQGKPCPIIFLTALDRPEILLDCLKAGGDDYIMKTTPMPEILKRVEYWTKRGGSEDLEKRRNLVIQQLEAKAQASA